MPFRAMVHMSQYILLLLRAVYAEDEPGDFQQSISGFFEIGLLAMDVIEYCVIFSTYNDSLSDIDVRLAICAELKSGPNKDAELELTEFVLLLPSSLFECEKAERSTCSFSTSTTSIV